MSTSKDKTIRIWDMRAGRCVTIMKALTSTFTSTFTFTFTFTSTFTFTFTFTCTQLSIKECIRISIFHHPMIC